jgi:hypothetical protein
MAKAYSLDLRQRVFGLLAKGKSKLFIEETLGGNKDHRKMAEKV